MKKNNTTENQKYIDMECCYKIGRSKRPQERLDDLQTANPNKLTLIHTCKSKNGSIAENSIHKYFRDYRISEEWFNFNNEKLNECIEIINEICSKINSGFSVSINNNIDININKNTNINNFKHKCNKCNYTSNDKSNFNRHIKSLGHININNDSEKIISFNKCVYVCECGEKSQNKSRLLIHMKTCDKLLLHEKKIVTKNLKKQIENYEYNYDKLLELIC
ncbi:GIY-YIg nuclease [Fadolivirus algeromassiliense]|jgi:hypothetical protein|uniref:GIY-YIg nuclease n=1 Tax=Fadolivirus FV1/VV64 TaxID=3070911 RepID=A0A7D3QTT2_9VIRU|nr:GIY-YIg nuclease [Fadolivirus algeromassiliense]QKF93585.1 GIY-YIg nuclease [Fadolivirus FV1/VV64]